jgi:hypothetical protein
MGAFVNQNIISIIFGITTVITSLIALRYKRLEHEQRVERILDEGRKVGLFLSREAMIKYLLEMYDQQARSFSFTPFARSKMRLMLHPLEKYCEFSYLCIKGK